MALSGTERVRWAVTAQRLGTPEDERTGEYEVVWSDDDGRHLMQGEFYICSLRGSTPADARAIAESMNARLTSNATIGGEVSEHG